MNGGVMYARIGLTHQQNGYAEHFMIGSMMLSFSIIGTIVMVAGVMIISRSLSLFCCNECKHIKKNLSLGFIMYFAGIASLIGSAFHNA